MQEFKSYFKATKINMKNNSSYKVDSIIDRYNTKIEEYEVFCIEINNRRKIIFEVNINS